MNARNFFITIVLTSLGLQVNSQRIATVYSSFHADPKGVFWAKNFDQPGYSSSILRDRMLDRLNKNPFVREVEMDSEGNIFASIRNLKMDYKRFGIRYISTSDKISDGCWKGKLKVEFNNEKYRIVIDHLTYNAPLPTVRNPRDQRPINWQEYKGTITGSFLNSEKTFFKSASLKELDIINFILIDQFSLIEEKLFQPAEERIAKSVGQ